MAAPIRNVVLFYGHVASNLGDLAINRGAVLLLRRAFPDARITVVQMNAARADLQARSAAAYGTPGDAAEAARLVGFRPDSAQAPRYALDPGALLDMVGAADSDLVVLTAGEHLFRYAEADNDAALFWRLLPAFAARARGLRCVMLPSTIGPLETSESAGLVGAARAAGLALAVREPRSAALLAAAVPDAAAFQGLDPAFFLDPPPSAPAREGRRIALALRSEGWGIRLPQSRRRAMTDAFEADGYRSSRALRFAAAFAGRALEAGDELRLIVQTEADQALVDAIRDRLRDAPGAERIEAVAPPTIEDYLATLAECDAVVAARFHALVMGLVAGRPVLGLWFGAHGHKIPGLLDLLGRPDLALDLAGAEPEAAAAIAFARLEAAAAGREAMEARLAALRAATQSWLAATEAAPAPAAGLDLDVVRPLGQLGFALAERAAARRLETAQDATETALRAAEATRREAGEAQRRTAAELAAAATEIAGLRAAGTSARAALDRAEAEIAALRASGARAQAALSRTEAEAAALRAAAADAEREHRRRAQRAARVNEALSLRLADMETSESWRIGHGLVRMLTAPKRMLDRRPVRRGGDADAILPEQAQDRAKAPPLPLHELLRILDEAGAPGVIAALRAKLGGDPATLGPALVQSARALAEAGAVEAEYPLVAETARLDRSAANLRTLFWAAQRAGDLRTAWAALAEIEALYGPTPTPGQQKFLAKMRSGPLVNVALLEAIRISAPRAFESIPGRIAYVLHNSLPYSSGGYATRAQGLALGLRENGFEVIALSRPGFPRDTKPELRDAALPAEDVIEGLRYLRADRPLRDAETSIAAYVQAAADVMEAQFRELRPEIVVAASAYLSALPALIAARRLGLPFIYEVRGFWEITRISRNPALEQSAFFRVQKLLEAEIGSHADHVFTLTGPMRDELVERGVPAEKITLLPNSCDPERFTPRPRDAALAARLGVPAEAPVIGYIGTFVQYEGLDDLARAAALLRRRGLTFRLMLVGNENTSGTERGPITTEIERVAAEEGLADWLILPGRVPHAEVEAYYSLIDVAPFPRKPQPVTEMVSPMKPLEALAMEKAVVVSSVRALSEMVTDGETGLVFEKGSVESLAEVLARLIGDAALRARLGRAGREWVARERTWTATAAAAKTEIDRVLGRTQAVENLEAIYAQEGAEGVAAALRDHHRTDPKALAAALVRASRALPETAPAEARLALVAEAARLDPSEGPLRTLFWAAKQAGDLRLARDSLARVERIYGARPTPPQRRYLAKMRGGVMAEFAVLDLVPEPQPPAVAPERGRIAYVLHNSLPFSSGGYATRAHGMALGLTAAGCEVICLTRPGYPLDIGAGLDRASLPEEEAIEGISYVRVFEPQRGGGLRRYAGAAAEALAARLGQLRPEVVIAASAALSALPALIAARRLGLPFIYEVRGFWEITRISREPEYGETTQFRVQKLLEAEIARHADHVFTLTGPMRDELVERGVPAEKITLLPNSCDPERFTPRPRDAALAARLGVPAEAPVIGYIGTFVQYEGLDDLARAAALLRRRGLAFRLMLVGNENTSGTERGPITTEIERVAAEEGLADWLILPGRVPHAEVEAYYSLIDVAPFPRKPQPVTEMVSPMKPLEALAMEKAVVVSSVRALSEMVTDGETGLVFEKGSVESLAEVLARLIGDAELRARLGRAGREWVARERTWTATAAAARVEIDRVLAERPAPKAEADQPEQAQPKAAVLPIPFPAPSGPESAPPTEAGRDGIFATVRGIYAEHNKARKKPPFSNDDWERTRLAFDMLEGAARVADIGIGQAQLANLLARTPEVRRVVGYDFRDYATRVDPPRNGRYDFRVWDITRPLDPAPEPADVVVAMEVLEHIAVDRFAEVLDRLRSLSPERAILATVPYKEKHPLYHHDKPHGHQQSFDDAKIEALFGPGCLYSDYRKKWYFVFAHDRVVRPEALDLPEFCARVRALRAQTTPAGPERKKAEASA